MNIMGWSIPLGWLGRNVKRLWDCTFDLGVRIGDVGQRFGVRSMWTLRSPTAVRDSGLFFPVDSGIPHREACDEAEECGARPDKECGA